VHRRDRLAAPAGPRTPHYKPRHAQRGPLAAPRRGRRIASAWGLA
jgi:hypothetical protein